MDYQKMRSGIRNMFEDGVDKKDRRIVFPAMEMLDPFIRVACGSPILLASQPNIRQATESIERTFGRRPNIVHTVSFGQRVPEAWMSKEFFDGMMFTLHPLPHLPENDGLWRHLRHPLNEELDIAWRSHRPHGLTKRGLRAEIFTPCEEWTVFIRKLDERMVELGEGSNAFKTMLPWNIGIYAICGNAERLKALTPLIRQFARRKGSAYTAEPILGRLRGVSDESTDKWVMVGA